MFVGVCGGSGVADNDLLLVVAEATRGVEERDVGRWCYWWFEDGNVLNGEYHRMIQTVFMENTVLYSFS